MFEIRSQQMSVFNSLAEKYFVRKVSERLAMRFPDDVSKLNLQAIDLCDFIEQRMIEARIYGINNQDDLIRYIDYLILYREEFEGLPQIQEILNRTDLSGRAKMEEIDEYVLFTHQEG